MGVGKYSTSPKRVRLPTPAQLIRFRLDLECKTRTNLPINHCAEMLTRTLRSDPGLYAQPPLDIRLENFFQLKKSDAHITMNI